MKSLLLIQSKLKAPKNQYNNFGKYPYRNCEDILEAVKPLLVETKTVLTLSDDIVFSGDRYYVKATATLSNLEAHTIKEVSAFAREIDVKKGMDSAQVTGAASSYARKYALNGLFAIDDTKDSDTTNQHDNKKQEEPPKPKAPKKPKMLITEETKANIFSVGKQHDSTDKETGAICAWLKAGEMITPEEADDLLQNFASMKNRYLDSLAIQDE